MAREVIKRVGTRAYRYRVESYRVGTKVRARWTYLGVVDEAGVAAPILVSATAASNVTRERLLEAFEHLAARHAYAAITAGAVATEAGLAHGTFYRYFKNKRELLVAALDRVREAFDRVRPTFDPPYGDVAYERERVRAWTHALGTMPASRGVIHAWFDALDGDVELEAARLARLDERRTSLAAYFGALAAAGTIELDDPAGLANALLTLIDATFRSGIVSGALDEATLEGVAAVFDRAIFQLRKAAAE